MGVLRRELELLAAARGTLLPWAPVMLGSGIGIYFALPAEPSAPAWAALAVAAALALVLLRRVSELGRAPVMAFLLVVTGLGLAGGRAYWVAGPVLGFRYYGPVEGRIVDIDRSFSDAIRLTLDNVRLQDVPAGRTPLNVRIALHGDDPGAEPVPGMTVRAEANLSPPGGPVAPGGFDFQRLAWFASLGAVGYTRKPLAEVAPPDPDAPGLLAFRARMVLSAGMQDRIGGQAGALSSAFMTGDRSGIDARTNEVMRAANLSHMISISGLHMSLLASFVLLLVRYGLALIPPVALRLNAKKVAAGVALVASTVYLALAGPDVATERSYIMAAVILAAVLADRRAISLRSVAIAAIIVMVLEPESIVEPGFQMSFAATVALIVAFERWAGVQARVPWFLRPLALLFLSSLVAGLATGPVAAAHFNRVAGYGLLANLLATPVMGLVVMPAGVIAAIAAPFGLADLPLWVMGQGTAVIIGIAEWVSGLTGAVGAVPAPHPLTLPLMGAGGAALVLGPRWPRWGGGAFALLAFLLWAVAERPSLLIASDGSLVGLMTAEGRALSKAKGAGFIAKSWLEDDGDLASQEAAFARPAFSAGQASAEASFAGVRLLHFTGKSAPEKARAACADGAIIVMNESWGSRPPATCEVFDAWRLRRTGAVAIYPDERGIRIVTAKAMAGDRPWNRRPPPRAPKADAAPAAVPGQ